MMMMMMTVYLVCEGLGVEVNRMNVHLIPHAQKVPVYQLPPGHGQAFQVTVHLTVYTYHTHTHHAYKQ